MKKGAAIYEGLYTPYDKDIYPEMHTFFGDRMPEIEANRIKAAEMLAALLPVETTVGMSLPAIEDAHRENALFLIDTEDNQRFWVTEDHVRTGFTLQEVSAGNGNGQATDAQLASARQMVLDEFGHLVGNITFTGQGSEIRNHGVVNIGLHFTHLNDYDETVRGQALCRFRHKDTEGNIVFPKVK